MNEEMIERLVDTLEQIGGHAYEALYRQVFIEAAFNFAWALMAAVAVVITLRLSKRLLIRVETLDEFDRGLARGFTWGGSVVTLVILAITALSNIQYMISKLANPDFWVIRYLINNL